MLGAIERLDHASAQRIPDCASRFERIATAEKSLWIPYYYASYALVVMSFDEATVQRKIRYWTGHRDFA